MNKPILNKPYIISVTVRLDEPDTWEDGLAELKDAAERLEMILTEKRIHESGR